LGDDPFIFVSYAHEDDALVHPGSQWLKGLLQDIQQELAGKQEQYTKLPVPRLTPSSVS
jgi:hypothetical protein